MSKPQAAIPRWLFCPWGVAHCWYSLGFVALSFAAIGGMAHADPGSPFDARVASQFSTVLILI